jgi:predicted small lipoprotein YifL
MKKIIILIFISSLILASCGKKGPPVYKEKTHLIIKQS